MSTLRRNDRFRDDPCIMALSMLPFRTWRTALRLFSNSLLALLIFFSIAISIAFLRHPVKLLNYLGLIPSLLSITANILIVFTPSTYTPSLFYLTSITGIILGHTLTILGLVCIMSTFSPAIYLAGDLGWDFHAGVYITLAFSIFTSFFLLLDLFLFYHHRRKCSNAPLSLLTPSQRSFIRVLTFNSTLLSITSLLYTILEPSWSYTTALFFSLSTALTIGFGDVTPSSTISKIFTIPFAAFSLVSLGFLVRAMHHVFVDQVHSEYAIMMETLRRKRHEKKRSMSNAFSTSTGFGKGMYNKVNMSRTLLPSPLDAFPSKIEPECTNYGRIESEHDWNIPDGPAPSEVSFSDTHPACPEHARTDRRISTTSLDTSADPMMTSRALHRQRTTTFNSVQLKIDLAKEKRIFLNRQLVFAAILTLIFWILGSTAFFLLEREQWSFFDAFYFTFITLSTIGYGDMTPKKPSTLIFFDVYVLIGVAVATYLGGVVTEWIKIRALPHVVPSSSMEPNSLVGISLERYPTATSLEQGFASEDFDKKFLDEKENGLGVKSCMTMSASSPLFARGSSSPVPANLLVQLAMQIDALPDPAPGDVPASTAILRRRLLLRMKNVITAALDAEDDLGWSEGDIR